MLSQHTSDLERASARSTALRARVPDVGRGRRPRPIGWPTRSARAASPNTKAPRIQAILREVARARGRLRPVVAAADAGRARSASTCVAAGRRAEDGGGRDGVLARARRDPGRHPRAPRRDAARARAREGLGREGASRARGARPAGDRLQLHVGLIRLGREICKAPRPRCEDCPPGRAVSDRAQGARGLRRRRSVRRAEPRRARSVARVGGPIATRTAGAAVSSSESAAIVTDRVGSSPMKQIGTVRSASRRSQSAGASNPSRCCCRNASRSPERAVPGHSTTPSASPSSRAGGWCGRSREAPSANGDRSAGGAFVARQPVGEVRGGSPVRMRGERRARTSAASARVRRSRIPRTRKLPPSPPRWCRSRVSALTHDSEPGVVRAHQPDHPRTGDDEHLATVVARGSAAPPGCLRKRLRGPSSAPAGGRRSPRSPTAIALQPGSGCLRSNPSGSRSWSSM